MSWRYPNENYLRRIDGVLVVEFELKCELLSSVHRSLGSLEPDVPVHEVVLHDVKFQDSLVVLLNV